jgi:hypothetical protein
LTALPRGGIVRAMTTHPTHWMASVLLGLGLATTVACGSESAPAGGDAKAGDTKTADAKAGDAKAGDAKAGDAKAGDAKADDTKAGDAAGGDAAGGDAAPAAGGTPADAFDGEEGAAYFAVDKKGVVKLAGGAFSLMAGSPDNARKFFHGANDSLYVMTFSEIHKLDGDAFKLVAKYGFNDAGSIEYLHIQDDNNIWSASFKGVGFYDGSKWTVTEKEKIDPDAKLLRGVVVDEAGNVWVASSNEIHVKAKDADTWTSVDLSGVDSRKPFFQGMAKTKTGEVYVLASNYLVKCEAVDKVSKIDIKVSGYLSLSDLVVTPSGKLLANSSLGELVRLDPAAPNDVWSKSAKDGNYVAEGLDAVAGDGRDRAWVVSKAGVSIVGPADEAVFWQSGSVPELVGRVQAVALTGNGPTFPAVGAAKKGGVKGKLLMEGAAVADTDVEMCPRPSMMYKGTPCEDSKAKFAAKSDAEGYFEFKDVPLGSYGIAVKLGDKWRITFTQDFGSDMKEGSTYDIGSITLKKD